jgi:N-dimethylarginine dimethylaminohydrolase
MWLKARGLNMSVVEVYNEWDPLEEIIVGSPKYARLPETNDKSFKAVQEAATDVFVGVKKGHFPEHIIEETEEDINTLIVALEKANVKVRRPKPLDYKKKFVTPYWEEESFFCYCPRDTMFAMENTIIETPCVLRSRYFETFAYKDLMIEYLQKGARWIAAPKPCLKDEAYNCPLTKNQHSALNNVEPIFDAANILRAGEDLFYLISSGGNELGLAWLQAALGSNYRVHACPNLYSSLHIDTTVTFLKPGLMLLNPARVNKKNLPPLFKKWDILWAPEPQIVHYSDLPSISSKWLGMNLLMINPGLAVVDKDQPELIKLLEKNKIDVIPLCLRHGRTLGGGFHCITLDVRRKGKLEKYF